MHASETLSEPFGSLISLPCLFCSFEQFSILNQIKQCFSILHIFCGYTNEKFESCAPQWHSLADKFSLTIQQTYHELKSYTLHELITNKAKP